MELEYRIMAFKVQKQGKGYATVCLLVEQEGILRWKTY